MYAPALTFPFVDADRRNPSHGDKPARSARVWLVVALVLLAVVWQLVRLLLR